MRRSVAVSLILCLVAVPATAQVRVFAQSDVTVGGTAVRVATRNANRWALNCTNTHASVHVRWGDSGVTAGSGQQIRAGAAIEIMAREEIWMISEGANVSMACTEELR